jgi:hypothetical protein
MESVVDCTRLFVNFPKAFWHRYIFGLIGSERRRLGNFTVPMFGPDPIGVAETGRPREHGGIEVYPDGPAKKGQSSLRILENIPCVDDGAR